MSEPMEVEDFSPLQAVIEEQAQYIEALKEEKEALEDKLSDLESELANRDDALAQIERLATLYV